MKHFRPLFFRSLDVRLPGLRVRRLQLNRHLKETASVQRHRHRFSQVLLYLSGSGRQIMGQETHPVRAGTAVILKPGLGHAFVETRKRRPICCAIDFEFRRASQQQSQVVQLTEGELAEARHQLATLGRLGPDAGENARPLHVGSIVLTLLDLLLRRVGWAPAPTESRRPVTSPVVAKARRVLRESLDDDISLDELSLRVGYQHDYLNRLLKQATGVTLGQMRASIRLERAKQLLAQPLRIGDVAQQVSFTDQNYFARWFRQQTGISPSQWRTETHGR